MDKTILAVTLICICAYGTCMAQNKVEETGLTTKPKVAVPAFKNRTQGHATRVFPGKYKEKNVKVGSNRRSEDYEQGGKRISTRSNRDVYEKQLERTIEFAPGSWNLPDVASEIAADEVSMALMRSGRFDVLSRSRSSIEARNSENTFTASELKDKGATYLVVGAISRFRLDEKSGTAYGVHIDRKTSRITLDLRVVNVKTGGIAYQATPTKSVTIRLLGDTTDTSVFDWEEVLREAIRGAADDMIVKLAENTGASIRGLNLVTIHVASNPPGADIMIDGVFHGNTPVDVKVSEGQHELALERQGYQPWERTIKAFDDMKVSPAMEKFSDPPKQPSRNE